jgi:hypothetical protein
LRGLDVIMPLTAVDISVSVQAEGSIARSSRKLLESANYCEAQQFLYWAERLRGIIGTALIACEQNG